MTLNVEAFIGPKIQQIQPCISATCLKAVHIEQLTEASLVSIRPDTPSINSEEWKVDNTVVVESHDSMPAKPPKFPLLVLASFVASIKTPSKSIFAMVEPSQPLVPVMVGLLLLQSRGVRLILAASVLVQQFTAFYLMNLAAFPLVTKSLTSGMIGVCGDFMAQKLDHRMHHKGTPLKYDPRRGLGIMANGCFVSGPIMHVGYNLFERILPISGNWAAMTHVVADTLILDTIFVATAFVVSGLMEGYAFRKDILPQLKRDYSTTLKASWATSTMLMPLEFVCFRFLPVTFRTLAMNLTDVIWDASVSFMSHRNRNKSDRIQPEVNGAVPAMG